ncbi:MAG: hypothetical protein ACTHKF_04005 [Candidatus Nitrosocosmicus sp.]
MTDDHKLGSDEKKTVLQSQMETSFNNSIQQTSLLKPSPLLEFKRQKEDIKKDSVEQKTTEKGFSDNHKENTGISIQKITLQYNPLNTDSLIDYYRQASRQLTQLLLDSLKLQKDYIDAFQPQWVDHMRSLMENYLVFQDKIIRLYIQYFNIYISNVFDIKNNNNNKRIEK